MESLSKPLRSQTSALDFHTFLIHLPFDGVWGCDYDAQALESAPALFQVHLPSESNKAFIFKFEIDHWVLSVMMMSATVG